MTATPGARVEPRAASGRRWVPYAVIATIGLLFAGGAALGADRQPHIWIIPPLVLTGMLLSMLWLSDRRREEHAARDAAARLGLRDTGAHPLPPLAPSLQAAEPAHMLAGHLDDGGPLRVAHARFGRRGSLAVAMTEIASQAPFAADPHGVLGLESTAAESAVAWVRDHPLGFGLVAEGGTLVVARPARRDEEPDFAPLVEAVAEARRRLA
jgi:hypothetical protein